MYLKNFEAIDQKHEEVLTHLQSFVKKVKFISFEMWFTSLAVMFLHSILSLLVLQISPFFKDKLFFMTVSKWQTCRKNLSKTLFVQKTFLLS